MACLIGTTGNCGINTNAPVTPGRVTPDITFRRTTFMQGNQVINGDTVPIWGFFDDALGGMAPQAFVLHAEMGMCGALIVDPADGSKQPFAMARCTTWRRSGRSTICIASRVGCRAVWRIRGS